jgi:hypothetical protein
MLHVTADVNDSEYWDWVFSVVHHAVLEVDTMSQRTMLPSLSESKMIQV